MSRHVLPRGGFLVRSTSKNMIALTALCNRPRARGGAVFQYTPRGTQTTFAPGLSRPRALAIYNGDLYVVTNTLDPVSGNLQSSILKVSANGVQTLFAILSTVNFAAEGLAIDRAGNVFVVAFDETSPNFASTIFKFTPDGVENFVASDLM
jgi:hypothetical protein